MPRAPRLQVAGGLYHVTTVGNRRQPIFSAPYDRNAFLDRLGRAAGLCKWNCLGYCLMTNHYHLLVETPEPNIAAGMHRLNSAYAHWFNRRYGFTGHLFERRYGGKPIESDGHLLETTRYIVLNPVRARLCAAPLEWPWSSYAATLGLEERVIDLAVDRLLAFFGDDVARARQRFKEFVDAGAAPARHVPVPGTGTWPD